LPAAALVAALLTACASSAPPSPAPAAAAAPPLVLGAFVDDYGNRFLITASEWTQLPHGRFHVREWHPADRFLVAENDSANAADGGRWTRIDWMPLEGMEPWTWAFCLSSFDAPSAAAARSVTIARRDTPRTGCNGYPFSRMRPVSGG
jgi:hypothetical protein